MGDQANVHGGANGTNPGVAKVLTSDLARTQPASLGIIFAIIGGAFVIGGTLVSIYRGIQEEHEKLESRILVRVSEQVDRIESSALMRMNRIEDDIRDIKGQLREINQREIAKGQR